MQEGRRKYTREFKLKVVQAYESGKSVAELTREYDLHANLVYKWAQEYRNNPTGSFRGSVSGSGDSGGQAGQISELEQMIGRLTMEVDFLKSLEACRERIDSEGPKRWTELMVMHDKATLSAERKCELVSVPQSSYYHHRREPQTEGLVFSA